MDAYYTLKKSSLLSLLAHSVFEDKVKETAYAMEEDNPILQI